MVCGTTPGELQAKAPRPGQSSRLESLPPRFAGRASECPSRFGESEKPSETAGSPARFGFPENTFLYRELHHLLGLIFRPRFKKRPGLTAQTMSGQLGDGVFSRGRFYRFLSNLDRSLPRRDNELLHPANLGWADKRGVKRG